MKPYHLHMRKDRELKLNTDIDRILRDGKYMSIAMCRDNEPYIVSLSYGYDKDARCLYFHSAKEGLKIDFLSANSRVCATIVNDKGYIDGACAHPYESLVLWGRMLVLEGVEEKRQGMRILFSHLEADNEKNERRLTKSEAAYATMAVLKLEIEQIRAKAGR